MHQAALAARASPRAWLPALAALAGLLAALALSGRAGAIGEAVEPVDTDVLEGQPFTFRVVAGVGDSVEQVQVTCAACGKAWTSVQLNTWDRAPTATNQKQRSVTFPSSLFAADAAGHPMWAQNYTIRVVNSLAEANVTVHIVDDWTRPNRTYQATETVKLQAAGFANGQAVSLEITKWGSRGQLRAMAQMSGVASGGKVAWEYRLPADLAADLDCPVLNGMCRNFTATVKGGSKQESVRFRVEPARLEASMVYVITKPYPDGSLPVGPPLAYNRTENVTVAVDARYHNNAPLTHWDRNLTGNASLNGTLLLVVERVAVAQGQQGPAVAEVAKLYAQFTSKGWRAEWTIPKNLSTTQPGADNPQYRVRLPEQEDRSGNVIPEVNGTAFKVTPLLIVPELLQVPPAKVERLANATAVMRIAYADGQPFTNRSNTSIVRADLVDAEGDLVRAADVRYLGEGRWSMDFQPALDYKPLGAYKLRLRGASDADGNEVPPAETPWFDLVPAKPRVDLRTSVLFEPRNATQGFVRGEQVDILYTIRYPDGSAYNRTHLPDGLKELVLNITKVDARGLEHGWRLVAIKPRDDLGRWAGTLPIEDLDRANPIGPWRWSLEVMDRQEPPNANLSSFTRWVRGASIGVHVQNGPEPLARAGATVGMQFKALYTNGTDLTPELAGSALAAHVAQLGPDGQPGEPEALLLPIFDEGFGRWRVAWKTAPDQLVGDYVFVVTGQDVFGNLVQPTVSRPVSVFVDHVQRVVLREPAPEAYRGDVVLVVFDGAEGDVGPEGSAHPRIELQKWNPLRNAWDREVLDVRTNDTSTPDHIGRLATDGGTNLGTYRFALFARNQQLAEVVASSKAFKVLPVEIARAWLPASAAAAAQPVSKGTHLVLGLERRDGDVVDHARIYADGAWVANATPLTKPGRFEVQWRTPFTLAAGPYDLVVRGRDLHNNTFATPPLTLNLTGAALQAKVPQAPSAALQRAQPLQMRVALQFPDAEHVRSGAFTVRFLLDGAEVASKALETERGGWLLNWTPPASAPVGRYRALLEGDNGLGDRAESIELFSFRLAEGVIQRLFAEQRSVANRTEMVRWVLPAQGTDVAMAFVLRDDAGNRREVPHNLTSDGSYMVAWRPARDEKLTRYTLEAQGLDASGNAVSAESRSLLLRSAQIGARFVEAPSEDLKPGVQARWVFELRYADGRVVPADEASAPSIAMVQGDRAVEPLPSLGRIQGTDQWVATWTPVEGQHSGNFKLALGGRDSFGNEIQLVYGRNVRIDEGLLKEVLGVPGFEALLVPFALLGAALLLRRKA